MLSPEKNDVDISKLFNWKDKITVYGVNGIDAVNVYIRLMGDADWNIARIKALRASAELRNKLHDETSDEFIAFIPNKNLLEKDNIIETLLALNMFKYRDEAIDNITIKFPNEPDSEASLEEQEKYQTLVDSFEEKRFDEIKKLLEKIVDKNRKIFQKKTLDELYELYKDSLIDSLCRDKMNEVFTNYGIVFGTYKDNTFSKRFFSSYEEFNNLPLQVKNQFIVKYSDLDIGVYDLKK